jgi:phage gp29-like protein
MAFFDFLKRNDKNLNSFTSRTALNRIRQDVSTWRDAMREAEAGQFPHRVKMQRLFVDTVLNGHVSACIEKRKNLTLLRDFELRNADGSENEEMEDLFETEWFRQFMSHALDAIFYGYSLVSLGDIINGQYSKIDVIKRWYISPDRLNVTIHQYNLSGYDFLKPPYDLWHVWCTTPSENGMSNVGYGLLYKVGVYEIINRAMLGFNADAAELYGQPIRVGTTNKTDEGERSEFASMLSQMGSSGWIIKDEFDTIEILQNTMGSTGFNIYADLEKRNEAKISKIILGHADALDSTPGKLGSDANGAAVTAMREIQTNDGKYIENIINGILIPKMRQVGFMIPEGLYFEFESNEDKDGKEFAELDKQKKLADITQVLKNSGYAVDPIWLADELEIPLIKAAPTASPTFTQEVQNALNKLYS